MKQDKKIIIIFISIIGFIMLSYPVTYILSKKNIVNISYDNFKVAKQEDGFLSYFTNLINRGKTAIENRVNNFFPLYHSISNISSFVNSKLDETLYNFLNLSTYHSVGNTSEDEVILKDDEHLILINITSKDKLEKNMEKQINFFNKISKLPTNTYIYFANRYEFYQFDNVNYVNNMYHYKEAFKKRLNDIKFGELDIKSKDEYLKYFFKSDHHYNMYGAYQSYKDIMTLMNEIPKEGNVFKVEDINYRGSMAKRSHIGEIIDNLYDIDIDLGEHKILVNDSEDLDLYKEHKIKNTKNIYYDHFVAYFNGMYGKIFYDFNNNSNRNLLILGDSFTWQIDNLIASHFDKTYIFNLNYVDYKINMDDFVKENGITDILFLYETSAVIFDQYNYDFENKIEVGSEI